MATSKQAPEFELHTRRAPEVWQGIVALLTEWAQERRQREVATPSAREKETA